MDPLAEVILGQERWITKNLGDKVKVGGPILLTEGYVLGYVVFDFSTAR